MRTYTQFLHKLANGKQLVGVEVGVFIGDNALSMLKHLNIKQLYLVDPYWNASRVKEKSRNRLSEYSDKITWIYKSSKEGIEHLPDNLDFVYLDGDHSYPTVRKEIELYFPKIKQGGILGGHDYLSCPGVKKAVDEFFVEQNSGVHADCFLPLGLIGKFELRSPVADNWLIIKPFDCYLYWDDVSNFKRLHYWTVATLKSVSKSARIKIYYNSISTENRYWEMLNNYAELLEFNNELLGNLQHYYYYATKQEKCNSRSIVNIIRECLLYNYGGIYFDFDILFIKSISGLAYRDEFFFENMKGQKLVCGGIIKHQKGDEALLEILERQKAICDQRYRFLSFMTIYSDVIKDKKSSSILNYKTFFPFAPGEWPKIFSNNFKLPDETIGVHWWNQMVKPCIVNRMNLSIFAENLISRIVREQLGEEIVENSSNQTTRYRSA